MNTHYDIAVIGGGPAGATFAREIARSCPEKRIVLIDEKPRTGSKVCGGLLAPDAQKVLAQFDLDLPKSILADPQIFDVKTIDLASGITRNYQRHYLNMDRAAFDEWLLSLIPDNVDVIRGRCHSLTDQAPGKLRLARMAKKSSSIRILSSVRTEAPRSSDARILILPASFTYPFRSISRMTAEICRATPVSTTPKPRTAAHGLSARTDTSFSAVLLI